MEEAIIFEENHNEAEDPRQANGNENRQIDSELLPLFALIRLWGRGECIVDLGINHKGYLTSNEEEDNRVGGNDNQTGQEES